MDLFEIELHSDQALFNYPPNHVIIRYTEFHLEGSLMHLAYINVAFHFRVTFDLNSEQVLFKQRDSLRPAAFSPSRILVHLATGKH